MENEVKQKRHAGGRPPKPDKKDQQLAVMCNLTERQIIEGKAKTTNTSVSEFLRSLALEGNVGSKIKTLPKEVLLFTATLNHLAANMNQVAKKRNRQEELNAMEIAELNVWVEKIKILATEIKNYLR